MQREPYSIVPADFGHWLAGFIDGEGCFMIGVKAGTPTCWFQLCVRADDAAIIREIAATTGLGKVYGLVANGTSRPQVIWTVNPKHDCWRLVELLDRYPLRAKKAADFAIWREAIRTWRGPRGELRNARLRGLMRQLRDGRAYEPTPEDEVPPVPVAQLSLLGEAA
jgi:hypothetical protein